MPYTVKKVAAIAGVSVRTLHHYDQIGLLKPQAVTEAGYRLYGEAELERLQQILFFRELGFSLSEIKDIVSRPDFDRKKALTAHRQMLLLRRERLDALLATVERTIKTMDGAVTMSEKDLFDGFDMSVIEHYRDDYAEEVRQKYDPKIVEESKRRTSRYTKQDWARIMQTGGEIVRALAALMDRSPADTEVQAQIARYHQYINDSFYTCPKEIFRGLGEMYVEDERFTAYYEKYRPGLAVFVRNAIRVYCQDE